MQTVFVTISLSTAAVNAGLLCDKGPVLGEPKKEAYCVRPNNEEKTIAQQQTQPPILVTTLCTHF